MSRNGLPSFLPLRTTRIVPPRSTTNSRLRSPGGAVTKIGELKLPTFFSLTPRAAETPGSPAGLAALVPEPGPERDSGPLPQPPHPASRTKQRARAVEPARGDTALRIAPLRRDPCRRAAHRDRSAPARDGAGRGPRGGLGLSPPRRCSSAPRGPS